MGIPYWDIQGTTIITAQQVRLTANVQSVQGSIWNNVVSRLIYPLVRCVIFSFFYFYRTRRPIEWLKGKNFELLLSTLNIH